MSENCNVSADLPDGAHSCIRPAGHANRNHRCGCGAVWPAAPSGEPSDPYEQAAKWAEECPSGGNKFNVARYIRQRAAASRAASVPASPAGDEETPRRRVAIDEPGFHEQD